MKGILGKKVGMTQIYTEEGQIIPVTVIEAGPCFVTQIKTSERDGYDAVQLGFESIKAHRLTKPERGHLRDLASLQYLREFKGFESTSLGQRIDASIFETGDLVDVTGTSKGKGFAGVIKRHHFKRQRKTHGQSDRERAPGSLGAGTTPGRTFKGKRMAGRMGNERVTVQNLKIVYVDPERNMIAVKGAVPGRSGGLLMIHEACKGRINS